MGLFEIFSKFQLQLLPASWIQEVLYDGFSNVLDFPSEFESYLADLDIKELLSSTIDFIQDGLNSPNKTNSWINPEFNVIVGDELSNSSRNFKTWQDLVACKVNPRAMLCFLNILIRKGSNKCDVAENRELNLLSTHLYFLLLGIPGASAYNIFDPILYSHAIEKLKLYKFIHSEGPIKTTDKDSVVDEHNESESTIVNSGVETEKELLSVTLVKLINDMKIVFKNFKLIGQEDSLMLTIQIMIWITRFETSKPSLNPTFVGPEKLVCRCALALRAYEVLLILCSPYHGETKTALKNIITEMLPSFLMTDLGKQKVSIKENIVIIQHSIMFLSKVLCELKDIGFIGIKALIQNICFKTPDRAESRSRTVQVIFDIMDILPSPFYSMILKWFLQFIYSEEARYRILALEMFYKLISVKATEAVSLEFQNENANIVNFSESKYVLCAVVGRLKDISPTVQAKAMSIFGNILASNNVFTKNIIDDIFITSSLNGSKDALNKPFFSLLDFFRQKGKDDTDINKVNILPGPNYIIRVICLSIERKKPLVKKAALQLLSNIFLLNNKWMTDDLLEMMSSYYSTNSLSIRKVVVQCYTNLVLKYPKNQKLLQLWTQGVLSVTGDPEIKSQEKIYEVMKRVILENIVPFKKQTESPLNNLPWNVLHIIIKKKLMNEFLFVCDKWATTGYIKPCSFELIKTHVNTTNNMPAWVLLSALTGYITIEQPEFVVEYFYNNVYNKEQVEEYLFSIVTKTVRINCCNFDKECQIKLFHDLHHPLSTFSVPTFLISEYSDICNIIIQELGSVDGYSDQWAGEIIQNGELKLKGEIDCDIKDEDLVKRIICTLGNCLSVCPNKLSSSTIAPLLKNLIETTSLAKNKVQGVTYWQGRASPTLKAVAVITLGKMSLQSHDIAKQLIPVFSNLLKASVQKEIRVNAMVALTDLCIRFTSLTEPYIPNMCICLKDKDDTIRQRTLSLFIDLIQQDYLKLRCPLFFHLLVVLNDSNMEIRTKLKSFIVNTVVAKNKKVMLQYFVESFYHYNRHQIDSTTELETSMSYREELLFTLAGNKQATQRRNIYKFMLENMAGEQKLRATAKLCYDVLDTMAEEEYVFKSNTEQLLQDALYILSTKDIRGTVEESVDDEECPNEAQQQAEAINRRIKKTFLTEIHKTNIIEVIVPILIKLKQKLTRLKSKVTKDLRACLQELMKDYKQEIKEILAADDILAAEIEFDLQQTLVNNDENDDDEESSQECVDNEALKMAAQQIVMSCKKQAIETSFRKQSNGDEDDWSDCDAASPLATSLPYAQPGPLSLTSPQPGPSSLASPQPGPSSLSDLCDKNMQSKSKTKRGKRKSRKK